MTKYIYMKLVGLILVILGFSYSITSFSSLYAYLYGDIIIANSNVYIMSIGLVIPLYIFIFGIYFYFYVDRDKSLINPFIIISGISMFIIGIIRLLVSNGVMQFIHVSFATVLIVNSILLIYGCIKYKY